MNILLKKKPHILNMGWSIAPEFFIKCTIEATEIIDKMIIDLCYAFTLDSAL